MRSKLVPIGLSLLCIAFGFLLFHISYQTGYSTGRLAEFQETVPVLDKCSEALDESTAVAELGYTVFTSCFKHLTACEAKLDQLKPL